jgi:hypothetical protein
MTGLPSKFHAFVGEFVRIPAAVALPPIHRAAQLVEEQC